MICNLLQIENKFINAIKNINVQARKSSVDYKDRRVWCNRNIPHDAYGSHVSSLRIVSPSYLFEETDPKNNTLNIQRQQCLTGWRRKYRKQLLCWECLRILSKK